MPKIITDEIVYQAVMQIVSERGYAGSTTKQMAEAANISEMTLFRKYGSKMELVTRSIASIIDQMGLDEAVHYTGDVRNDLLRIVMAYQNAAVEYGQFMVILITDVLRYPEMGDMVDTPFEVFNKIGALLVRYQAEGVLQQDHPLHTLAALFGPVMFINLLQNTVDDQVPPFDLSHYIDTFIDGHEAT